MIRGVSAEEDGKCIVTRIDAPFWREAFEAKRIAVADAIDVRAVQDLQVAVYSLAVRKTLRGPPMGDHLVVLKGTQGHWTPKVMPGGHCLVTCRDDRVSRERANDVILWSEEGTAEYLAFAEQFVTEYYRYSESEAKLLSPFLGVCLSNVTSLDRLVARDSLDALQYLVKMHLDASPEAREVILRPLANWLGEFARRLLKTSVREDAPDLEAAGYILSMIASTRFTGARSGIRLLVDHLLAGGLAHRLEESILSCYAAVEGRAAQADIEAAVELRTVGFDPAVAYRAVQSLPAAVGLESAERLISRIASDDQFPRDESGSLASVLAVSASDAHRRLISRGFEHGWWLPRYALNRGEVARAVGAAELLRLLKEDRAAFGFKDALALCRSLLEIGGDSARLGLESVANGTTSEWVRVAASAALAERNEPAEESSEPGK